MSSTDGMMKVDGIELWELYTKSVEPLEKHRGAAKVKVRNNPAVWRTPKDVYTMFIEKRHPPSAALHVSGNPERTPIPRRLRRKFKSELTIDLHGYTRHINDTLSKFCHKCISNNIRSITIVTGKGSGVVWQAVREWLEIHIELITGFFEIRDASGGSGAYGVYLRVLRHKHR
jgi:DNA-nicking Smr family endonuclease